ncbi:hypothetical protein ACFYVR_17920 [Rhodococcus sp. NPDC003318]|uniref:hypothetical protein n=1 Tax=Rhodococcus sp. NPDC003318 TaxID=3364503 RepID=UPI0036889D2B
MSGDHAALMAELRSLATAALDRIEPILERLAENGPTTATTGSPSAATPGAEAAEHGSFGCSWCPVCALVALVRGEQHDLVTLVASQLTVLIAWVRALLDDFAGPTPPSGGPPEDTPRPRRAFVPIQVRIDDNPTT